MPRKKNSFKGSGAGSRVKDWPDNLRETLRSFCPDAERKTDEEDDPDRIWTDVPGDDFVNHVLVAADTARSNLHWLERSSTKNELRAEQESTLKSLQDTLTKLRNLSPDLDRLLPMDAEPEACAEAVEALIPHFEQAGAKAEHVSVQRISQQQREVILEMVIDVLRELRQYGIAPAETADPVFGYESTAVKILQAIGDALGHDLKATTWRDLIGKAKDRAPDLATPLPASRSSNSRPEMGR